MAVAISDVRFRAADYPRNVGVQPESPRPVGTADGVTTIMYVPLGKAQLVAGSLQLYFYGPGVIPPTPPSPVPNSGSTAFTVSQQGQIVWAIAPGSGGSAIVDSSAISATYQTTVFSDADLTNVLNRAIAGGYTSDAQVLAACQIEIIDVVLADVDRMKMLREAEYISNPAAVVAAYTNLLKDLRLQIQGDGRPGESVPFMMRAGVSVRPYQPTR